MEIQTVIESWQYDLCRRINEILSAGYTITLVRRTSTESPEQYAVQYLEGYFKDYSEQEPDETYFRYETAEEIVQVVLRHILDSGEVRYIVYHQETGKYIIKLRNYREPRKIYQIVKPEYLDTVEHSVVKMQVYFRKQYLVRNEISLFYDCSEEEVMVILKHFKLTVPPPFASLESWISSATYPGIEILKWYENEPDLDALDN